MQVISDAPGSMRANIKSRQMSLNQTMKLWNLGNEIMFRLSALMSFILGMEITIKWLIAPLYRANTDESFIWHFSLYTPPCSHSGGYKNQKITFVIAIESGIAIRPIYIKYMTLNSQMTNLLSAKTNIPNFCCWVYMKNWFSNRFSIVMRAAFEDISVPLNLI